MNNELTPVLITVFYAVESYAATLQLKSNNDRELDLTVIHESFTDVAAYELNGYELSDLLHANDGESLTIIMREHGRIIASAILAIDTALAEQMEAVLRPCAVSNIIVEQCESAEVFALYGETTQKLPTLEAEQGEPASSPEVAEVAQ